MRKIGFIILLICFYSNNSNAQLIGCPTGCDTLIFSSSYATQSENWKVIPLGCRRAGCVAGTGDRWEWGTLVNSANTVCDPGNWTAVPAHSTGQTSFWKTELAGCFCNSCTGVDSMYKYRFFDFSGPNVAPPVQIEFEQTTDGCGPDNLSFHVGGARVWSSNYNFTPWVVEILNDGNIALPVLDNLVGGTSSLGLGFFMTSVCNGSGSTIANFKIRTCRKSCTSQGPVVPTMGEWGLICLFLFFINLGLIYKFGPKGSLA